MKELTDVIICGDSREILKEIPNESVGLVFTSPPYFNARPEYALYESYDTYLESLYDVFDECHRILKEGRFCIVNTSPVLIPRRKRSESSVRIPIPFDLNYIMRQLDFDFMDDIIWVKPEGAGWGTSRGRRFSKDRTPLQYKTVPVTEYVMVYRKHSDRLIDWNIRSHDQHLVELSKVPDGYERTNVWKINPSKDKKHPAVFPYELADKVVKYYSFVDDIVLDPFVGSGTTALAARNNGRHYIGIDKEEKYVGYARKRLSEK